MTTLEQYQQEAANRKSTLDMTDEELQLELARLRKGREYISQKDRDIARQRLKELWEEIQREPNIKK